MAVSQLSNYGELAVLNWAFTPASMSGPNARPTAWYLGLSTTQPSSTGAGAAEPVGNGYARQAVTFQVITPSNPAQCNNTGLLSFAASGGDFGTIVYGVVYDALTLGNCWALGPLLNPKLIQNGDTLQFQPGSLAISLT